MQMKVVALAACVAVALLALMRTGEPPHFASAPVDKAVADSPTTDELIARLRAKFRATEDLDDLRVRAEQGNAQAQLNLGNMYVNGRGVPEDDVEAVRWYRLAAEQGNAGAQGMLGAMYAEGDVVPQDYAEAVRWIRRGAEQGNAWAQGMLGALYAQGDVVPQDNVSAHMWLNLAAAQSTGEARALFVEGRDRLTESMAREDLSEAQRRAREWSPE